MIRAHGADRAVTLGAAVTAAVAGCSGVYYSALEKVGYHKRDILVNRVKRARDSQEASREQFRSALERFNAVLAFDGGELQDRYESLRSEFEAAEDKARAVHDRVDAVEEVATALFDEWTAELDIYTNQDLRRESARQLAATRARYHQLISAMRRAEKRVDPVLAVFRDHVLFLKHNLNARAVAAIRGELASVETDVGRLLADMEASIRESDAFIGELERLQ